MPNKQDNQSRRVFAPLYDGLKDHLNVGAFSGNTFGLYCALHLHADYETGVVRTNAAHILHEMFGGNFSRAEKGYTAERVVRQYLDRLRKAGYINYESTPVTGKRPILIHKYEVRAGKHKGRFLDAFAEDDFKQLHYVTDVKKISSGPVTDVIESSESSPGVIRELSGNCPGVIRESSENCPSDDLLYMEEERKKLLRRKREQEEQEEQEEESRSPSQPGGFADNRQDEERPDPEVMEDAAAPPLPATTQNDGDHLYNTTLETSMGIRTCQEGAAYLAKLIYKLLERTPTEGDLVRGENTLLGLVTEERKQWDVLRLRVHYACKYCRDQSPMKNKETGRLFTWYDALSDADDPVASFKKNYPYISKDTHKWAVVLDEEYKKQDAKAQDPEEYARELTREAFRQAERDFWERVRALQNSESDTPGSNNN